MKALPDSNPPSWIGLPITAESQLKSIIATRILSKLTLLQDIQDDDMNINNSSIDNNNISNNNNQMNQQYQIELKNTLIFVEHWLKALPDVTELPNIDKDSLCNATSSPLGNLIK